MNTTEPIMVSVHCAVYNQAPYIRQCLDGIVMQQTTFRMQVLVHDDASNDGSADIIREYAAKYPDLIVPIIETVNQYSTREKAHLHFWDGYERGNYIAFCDGDDYWTDPLKLQKQVDYLESHPHVVLSCHVYNNLDQETGQMRPGDNHADELPEMEGRTEFEFDRYFNFKRVWLALLTTMVYRAECADIDFLLQFKYSNENHLIYDLLGKGAGVCHNFNGAVYRILPKGMYYHKTLAERFLVDFRIKNEFVRKTHEPMFAYYNSPRGWLKYALWTCFVVPYQRLRRRWQK